VSLYAHFRKVAPRYPVAVGVSVTLWTESVLGLMVVHHVFDLTKDQATLAQGLVVAIVGLVALIVSQSKVTPVEDAIARERVALDANRRRP
jgi:putative Mn2+ efflux pump MntP